MNMQAINQDVIQELIERHSHIVEPTTFRLYSQQWDLLPGVYAPHLTQGASLFIDWLPFPIGGAFCEIGCGCGYLSVIAAKRGCSRVVACDLSSQAVNNTCKNIVRHSVKSVVEARVSNLFSEIGEDEKFDLIFWNSSFVDGGDIDDDQNLDVAIYDVGYQAHEQFLKESKQYLRSGGRVMLGFTDLGSLGKLSEIAKRLNLSISILRCAHAETQYRGISFQLLEILPQC